MLSSASINGSGYSFINFTLFCETPVGAQELGGSGQALHGRRWHPPSRDHQGQPGAQASSDGDVGTHMFTPGLRGPDKEAGSQQGLQHLSPDLLLPWSRAQQSCKHAAWRVQPLAELGPQGENRPPQPQPRRRLPRHPLTFFFFLLSKGSVKELLKEKQHRAEKAAGAPRACMNPRAELPWLFLLLIFIAIKSLGKR